MTFPIITLLINFVLLCMNYGESNIFLLLCLLIMIIFGIAPIIMIALNEINLKKYTIRHFFLNLVGLLILFITFILTFDFTALFVMGVILIIISIWLDIEMFKQYSNENEGFINLIAVILSNPFIPIGVYIIAGSLAILIEGFGLGF